MMTRDMLQDPAPLFGRRPSVRYPVHALAHILGPAAERMAEVICVPPALAAQSLLATSALAAQPHFNVHLDGRVYPLSLFLLTMGDSGTRKSSSDQQATAPAEAWEEKQWKQLAADTRKTRVGSHAQRMTAAGVVTHAKQPRLITSEPTIEALVKGLCQDFPSMGLFNSEGGQFLGSTTMQRDNRLKAVTTFSKLWDGDYIDRARSMAGESTRAYHRRLSMHLMLQPYLGEELMRDKKLLDQGFLARFLITYPENLMGNRFYNDTNLAQDTDLLRYQQRITTLLERPWQLDIDGALMPAPMHLTEEAKYLWCGVNDVIEYELNYGRELYEARAFAAKAPQNTLRIAGVLACIEGCEQIEAEHITRASALVAYYMLEVLDLLKGDHHTKIRRDAHELLEWLIAHRPEPFPAYRIAQIGPTCCRTSTDYARKVLIELQIHQWVFLNEKNRYEFCGERYVTRPSPACEPGKPRML